MSYAQLQIRRDTAANWTSNNPTLAAGEWGFETDTGNLKIGTGSAAWTSLAYLATGILSGTSAPTSGVGVNGDFYINTSTSYLYGPKASGSWPSGTSLIGPAGSWSALTASSPLTGGGSGSSVTVGIQASSASQAGYMSAAQATLLAGPSGSGLVTGENGVYDVTQYGVLTSNSGSANLSAINTLLGTTAGAGSTIWFPPGTYNFSNSWTTLTKAFHFRGSYGASYIGMTIATSGSWITVDQTTNNPTTFDGLSFYSDGVNQTAGATIELGDANGCVIRNCEWTGNGAANWMFNAIDMTSTGGPTTDGNGCVIDSCNFGQLAGTWITLTDGAGSTSVTNCIGNGSYNAGASYSVAGINITTNTGNNGGAMLINNCDIIKCQTDILINPVSGTTAASIYINNCYLDQGTVNALSITGAGTVQDVRVTGSWLTTLGASSSVSCVNIGTSGSSVHQGIRFMDCYIFNPNSSATSTGITATAVADLGIKDCDIAGWTTSGIAITPASAGTCSPDIANNRIGPGMGVAGNGIGIVLNAGSFNYGTISIQGNILTGNTTPMSQGSLNFATLNALGVFDNIGLIQPCALASAFTSSATGTAAQPVPGLSTYLPAGTYLIETTVFVSLPTAFAHTFSYTFSGTASGPWSQVTTIFTTTNAALAPQGAAAASFATGIVTPTLVATDYYTFTHTVSLTVTAGGTFELNVANSTSTDSIVLAVGSNMQIFKTS